MAKYSESAAFNVTEVLHLRSSDGECINNSGDLSKLVKKMPKLRCLHIEHTPLASGENGDLNNDRGVFFHLPSSLEELSITQCGLEDDNVLDSVVSYFRTKASTTTTKINPRDFSLYVASNTLILKKLDLSNNFKMSDAQWARLINSLHNVKLEEIDLLTNHEDIYDVLIGTGSPVLAAVTRFLKSNTKLKVLKLSYFALGAPAQWAAFSSVLESHPCLEELEIQSYRSQNDNGVFDIMGDSLGLDHITNAIASNCKLKKVTIQFESFGQLESICRYSKDQIAR
jgi:hypothetical protein